MDNEKEFIGRLNKLVNMIYEEIVAVRRDFHAHPELSGNEIRTAKKISDYLSALNIPHVKNVAGHGIVATLEGKKSFSDLQRFKVIGIRADMDALPIRERNDIPYKSQNEGIMHACGHDIHIAALLGTAKILKSLENELNGTIKFFFEPAEETIGGARQMIELGFLENPTVDAVFAFHVSPNLPCHTIELKKGIMNAASTEFSITIKGSSCHGAYPHLGNDPIVAAAQIVTGLQSIISRKISPVNVGLITIGKFEAGSKGNIIPSEAKLTGIIRALDNDTRFFLKEQLKSFSEKISTAFDTQASVVFEDSYPVLENDREMTELMESVALKLFPKEKITYMSAPSLGADDFSYFTECTKGVYFNIGTKKEGETMPQSLHSEHYSPDENSLKTAMLMEIMGVFEILNQLE